MNQKSNTIRLIYPQWQGGIVSHWMPDIPAEDSSKGYYLGARILNMLAPESSQKAYEVPVSTDAKRKVEKGIMDREDIIKQTKSALEILEKSNPEKIVTLGGECSVSVVVRLINDIASNYDIIGLTIAEPMPRIAIKLRNMMSKLPLFK